MFTLTYGPDATTVFCGLTFMWWMIAGPLLMPIFRSVR